MCSWLCIREGLVTEGVLLLLLCLSFVSGISLSPCGVDGVQEILADQETHFTCTAEKATQWILHSRGHKMILAKYEKQFQQLDTFDELFVGRMIDAHRSNMTIKPVNNTKVYDHIKILNSSLGCSLTGEDNQSASCGLNYGYPPQEVSCTAANVSWSVSVSCSITNVYSSRNRYACQLICLKDMLKNQTIEIVSMVTSPTSEKISKSQVKMSGSCQFNKTLPAEEGTYKLVVSVSPGSRQFSVSDKQFTVDRPKSPTMSCGPQVFVLENTNVTCTCRTTSLGHPAGYLRWIVGNHTNQEMSVKQTQEDYTTNELHYTQVLTLTDHDRTWFRCDIIWGNKELRGQSYRISVGYAAMTPRLWANGHEGQETVMEGDQVHFKCESDGRPTPNVSINNDDIDAAVFQGSSNIIYTVIARCEDTATYTCSAWNEFSRHVTTSYSLLLEVKCKPRNVSSTYFSKMKVPNKNEELSFDVIAFPLPTVSGVWFTERIMNNSELFYVKAFVVNSFCKSDKKHRYISRCTLTMLVNASYSRTGWYKVEVTNEHGDENFTVELSYGRKENSSLEDHLTVFGCVAGGGLFITAVVVLILLTKKRIKDGAGEYSSQRVKGCRDVREMSTWTRPAEKEIIMFIQKILRKSSGANLALSSGNLKKRFLRIFVSVICLINVATFRHQLLRHHLVRLVAVTAEIPV